MSSGHRLDFFPATSEFCSFLHPPHSRRVSPFSDELTHSSPWNLSIDTDFEDYESHGDGCAYSTTSILCDSLGLSSPNSPRSPSSPSFKAFSSDSPRNSPRERNGASLFADHPRVEIPEQSVDLSTSTGKGPTVFVWDMDETLIIFQTLLDGQYVQLFDGLKDFHKATQLGRRWERLILEVCDEYFFYQQAEEFNHSNVDSLQEYDDGIDLDEYKFEDMSLTPPLNSENLQKLRYLYRYISQLYEQGLETLLSPEQAKEWEDLYEETDSFTDGWLSSGRQKLKEFQKANEQALQEELRETTSSNTRTDNTTESIAAPSISYNYLVTSGTLIPTLAKCLLFKLNPYFKPSNIFSSREVGKLQCCRWIRERFLDRSTFPKFCVIGDGPDEREAARILTWPFVTINIDPNSSDQLPMLSIITIQNLMKSVYMDSDAS